MKYLQLTALLMVLSTGLLADSLRVFGYDLDYRLQPDGTGHYHDLMRELQARGVPIELSVVPLPRAIRSLSESQEHCVFPATINAVVTNYPEYDATRLISGEPIDRISLRVFTRAQEPVISSMEELNDKRVALWGGLDPAAFLSGTTAIVEPTPSESVRVRMLNARRLDVIIGFVPDVLLVAEAENLPIPVFDESLALFRDEGASIICHDSPKNRAAMAIFDEVLNELRETGWLREIMGPYADIVD